MKTILLAALMSAITLSAANEKTETAVFGGGCFWCVEGTFQIIPGVSKVQSGYAGGHVDKPTYEMVCGGNTGHAEVVQVTFDPAKVSFRDLVDLFWYMHDPTTLNRQGHDSGTQYRSAVFTSDDAQKKAAEASLAEHQKEFNNAIVTEITPLKKFYPAEDYHQNFVNSNPNQGYVCSVAKPKIEKFRLKLAELAQTRQGLPK